MAMITTTMTTRMTDKHSLSLVRLLQLVSPALPVGAYAYSQGMEHAVQADWVHDRNTAQEWITGVMQHNLATLDLPVLCRCHDAWKNEDETALHHWSRFLGACRETAELRAEDRQMGLALCRLLQDLQIAEANPWLAEAHCNWVLMFALAAVRWEIPLPEACTGFLWSWCENQVAAAIKLVPLGQTDGQRILQVCSQQIPGLVQQAQTLPDDALGQFSPALAIGSALHEGQYSRMFRS